MNYSKEKICEICSGGQRMSGSDDPQNFSGIFNSVPLDSKGKISKFENPNFSPTKFLKIH